MDAGAASRAPDAPDPEFVVLGAAARPHAAVPALEFDVHVTEPLKLNARGTWPSGSA